MIFKYTNENSLNILETNDVKGHNLRTLSYVIIIIYDFMKNSIIYINDDS